MVRREGQPITYVPFSHVVGTSNESDSSISGWEADFDFSGVPELLWVELWGKQKKKFELQKVRIIEIHFPYLSV
jgi:hypothetical protein